MMLNVQLKPLFTNEIDTNLDLIFDSYTVRESGYKKFRNLVANNSDILFGDYTILAILLEIELYNDSGYNSDHLSKIETTNIYFFKFIRYIFLARFAQPGTCDREVEKELNKCKFNQQQRDFIWKWVRREIDLVAITESENN